MANGKANKKANRRSWAKSRIKYKGSTIGASEMDGRPP
jgi:hypothetical protein